MVEGGQRRVTRAAASLLRWIVLWPLLGLFAAVQLADAGEVPGIDNVHFRAYGTAQGMSQATTRVITQDRNGFIWIGSQDGLNRFDGYGFRVYKSDRDDPWSLSQNHVWSLAADPDGSLWVGTQAGGLNHYDPALDRFTAYRADPAEQQAIAANHVTALLIDRDQRLWIANSAGRLQWFDRAAQRFDSTPIGVHASMRMVRSMRQAADSSVWLGAREGLWRVDADGTHLTEVRAGAELPLDVYSIEQTPDGDLWIGTAENGLYQLHDDGSLVRHFSSDPAAAEPVLHDTAIRALLADPDGGLWIAGNSHGLARLDAGHQHFIHYTHDPARDHTIAANRLSALYRADSGALFVGSWANGFSVQSPRTEAFTRIDSVAGDPRTLPSRQALTVWGDIDGTLWVGVLEGGGLVHLDPAKGVIARYTHDPNRADSLSHDFVQYVTRTRDGSLWIATMGGGLNRLRPGSNSFEHLRHDADNPGSLVEDSILYVYEDRGGTLWIGTMNQGLDELCADCRNVVHHQHVPEDPDSLGGEAVSSIVETPAGDLWLAMRSGGLDRYHRDRRVFEHFRSRRDDPTSIGGDAVSTLSIDSRGELWVGTQGGGVSHLLPGSELTPRFETFGSKNGLAVEAIGAIVDDEKGQLWISTTAGISRLDRETHRVVNFGPREGTLAMGYWINGVTRLPGGRIVFSGLDGISVFDPRLVATPPPPKPMATGLLLQNLPIALSWRDPTSPLQSSIWQSSKVALDHDHDNVTFEFAAFDFSNPESIQYSYRLDGHDQQWIETPASRRFATYTDLNAGSYELRIRARHDGQDWSHQEARIKVEVAPAPWASPRAYAAYAMTALLLIYLSGLRVRANLRRRALGQEAIRLSEERLKLALWGSGSELWDIDLRTGRMHRENKLEYLAATVEATAETIEAYRPFVHKDDLAHFSAALAAHLSSATPVFEASYRTTDRAHDWVWVLTRGRVVERDSAGQGLRMTGTTHDINALKRAEEALRRLNEELELRVERRTADVRATNVELQHTLDRLTLTQRQLLESEKLASLGGLVAGIAHEINTPLGVGVTAASHLAEESTRLARLIESGGLTQSELLRFQHSAQESSELILRNLQRADRLVKSFKQVAVDQSNEDRRVVDLGMCINEILTTLGPALKKTALQVEVLCAVPVVCETAPGALYQIVTNLVMNSLTHGFPGGASGSIGIGIAREGEDAVIDYRDNGAGMDETTCARIFDPFFTTRRGQGGSGLGMHIVYNLITQVLGGTIKVDSAPGKGIHLAMRFPAGRGVRSRSG
ncbi:MAG: two-component regulator propeller domain-containing protein [Tahibacter sp.]